MALKSPKIRQNQFFGGKEWHGTTHKNHLNAILQDDPYLITEKIRQLQDVNLEMDMVSFVEKFGTYTVKKRVYQWGIEAYSDKNYPLRGAWEDKAGTITVGTNIIKTGANGTKFYLDFDQRVFSVTEVIAGHKPDKYKILIVEHPIFIAGVWRYECQLINSSADDFIDISELELGKKFSSEYGLTPDTMSYRGMDIGFSSPAMLQAECSSFRIQHEVPGNMVNMGKIYPLKFGFKGSDGKEHMSWISNVEWEFLKTIKTTRAKLIKYGKSNRWENGSYGNIDKNGFAVEAGSGWKEQINPSNKHSFNLKPDLDEMVEIMLDAVVGKTSSRTALVSCGEYGAIAFSKAVEDKLGSVQYENAAWLENHLNKSFEWSGNNVAVNLGEFNKVMTVRGITFIINVDPYKDDRSRNKEYHPNGGVVSSYEYDIMGFGSGESKSNMQIVRVEGEDPIFAVEPGLRSPWSDKGTSSISMPKRVGTSVDSSILHYREVVGSIVWDPTKVIQYYPEMVL